MVGIIERAAERMFVSITGGGEIGGIIIESEAGCVGFGMAGARRGGCGFMVDVLMFAWS